MMMNIAIMMVNLLSGTMTIINASPESKNKKYLMPFPQHPSKKEKRTVAEVICLCGLMKALDGRFLSINFGEKFSKINNKGLVNF